MVTFDIINVEVHPSAAEDTMLMDNEGVAGAVAEMSDDQISLLRKFDQLCSEIATELEVAESDYRDISATSSSVDDMLDKCEVRKKNLIHKGGGFLILNIALLFPPATSNASRAPTSPRRSSRVPRFDSSRLLRREESSRCGGSV